MDLSQLLAALGSLVLERAPDGLWKRHGPPPPWCAALGRPELEAGAPFALEAVFPFLEVFLPEAEGAFRAERPAGARSGFWTELGIRGEEVHLEAIALRIDSRSVLVITRDEERFTQRELVVQRARELRHAHNQLTREVELKEVLIHSIVHDLASPLHGIIGALSLLSELSLGGEVSEWVDLALRSAERQKALLADILEVFSAERDAIATRPDPADAPDLARVIQDVVNQVRAVARVNQIDVHADLDERPLHVVAEWLNQRNDTVTSAFPELW